MRRRPPPSAGVVVVVVVARLVGAPGEVLRLRGYRIGGNVFPLDRRPPATASGAEGGGEEEFECVPRGGEGLGYAVKAFASGVGCCAAAAAVVAAWARTRSSP